MVKSLFTGRLTGWQQPVQHQGTSASRFKWQREGEAGMLRAVISSSSANLPVQPGLAPTYTRALGRCWASFWAAVKFDALLTYSSGQCLPCAARAGPPPVARLLISQALTH